MRASATSRHFGGWLEDHIIRKRRLDQDAMVAIARLGAAELLGAGVTTTADYSFSGAAATAAGELGLRAIVYLEVFGSDPDEAGRRIRRAPGLAQAAEEQAPCPDRDLAARAVHLLDRAIPLLPFARAPGRDASGGERRRERVAAPRGRAARRRTRLPDPRPRALARSQRSEDVRSAPSSSRRIASRWTRARSRCSPPPADVPVAHCPRSNSLLGCGIAPLTALRAAGGNRVGARNRLASLNAVPRPVGRDPRGRRRRARQGAQAGRPHGHRRASPRYPGLCARSRPRK